MTKQPPRLSARFAIGALFAIALFATDRAAAQTIFNGPEITFTKAAGADAMLPENQDAVSDLVAFTRGDSAGLFNAVAESSFSMGAPSGTRWATGFLPINSGLDIDAANFASLTFTDWATAFGGQGNLQSAITMNDAVVHLVDEDIYLNLRFTGWAGNAGGGAFSYTRSTAIPEPGSAVLALLAVAARMWRRR